MIRKILLTAVMVGFGAGAAYSMPVGSVDASNSLAMNSFEAHVQMIGGKKYKRFKQRAGNNAGTPYSGTNSYKAPGRVVKDTCPGGDHACINELKANCDKAGGGLSTEPDGGVDCFVVGIHDQ